MLVSSLARPVSSPFRRSAVCLGAACVAGIGLAAQQAPPVLPDQRPAVTLRTEINLVEIDAIVTDSAGRFVPFERSPRSS